MDLQLLLIRLEELRKDKNVEHYILFRDTGMLDYNLFDDENAVEYEFIERDLKNGLIEEINIRSSHIFENVNLRDFNLSGIRHQLDALVHPHWQSRSEEEQKRDRLLGLYYHFYSNQYNQVTKYVELLVIDKIRREFKEKIEQQLIGQFKNILINELTSRNIQELLRRLDNHYSTYLKARAKELFEGRTDTIVERDVFGYIDFKTYERCLSISLREAIEFYQLTNREEILELYLVFLRNKINEGNDLGYSGNIDEDLCNYIVDFVAKRDHEKIVDDTFKLIELNTYLEWRYFALEKIKNEYPNVFVDDDDDIGDQKAHRFIWPLWNWS